jgi:hypothetical protein
MNFKPSIDWFRVRVCVLHFLVSLALAFVLVLPAFLVWFPGDYSKLSGGDDLVALLIAVDVVIGPFLTALIADGRKSKRMLMVDLSAIFLLQALAFLWGANALIQARPVALVFEFDQFRVVSAGEVLSDGLDKASKDLLGISWVGPKILSVRRPENLSEQLYEIDLSVGGGSLAGSPKFWLPYESNANEAWRKGVHLAAAKEMRLAQRRKLEDLALSEGIHLEDLRVLPLVGRRSRGYVVLAGQNGRVIGVVSE